MEKWQDPQTIALWIAIVLVLIFTILFFVVRIMHIGYKRMAEASLHAAQMQLDHQKKLLETNLQAQERERTRIASDLHDSLIGKLTVIRMKSQMGLPINDIAGLLEESIAEARRISHDLTPPLLEFSPVEELLDEMVNPWREKLDIIYKADVRATHDLLPAAKIQILRIVQELLTNTIKHANATKVCLQFRHTPQNVWVLVQDNGCGFDSSLIKRGLGLSSMELRMQYLNARYRVKSAPGKGTKALLVAPILNEA